MLDESYYKFFHDGFWRIDNKKFGEYIESYKIEFAEQIQTSLIKNSIQKIWYGMIGRCHDPKYTCYKYYGEHGIYVCDDWRYSLKNFHQWATSHGYEPGLSIDRIDPRNSYLPNNCQWLSRSANSKKSNTDKKWYADVNYATMCWHG